ASSSFQTNRNVELKPGESAVIDGREVTYVRPIATVDALKLSVGSELLVKDGGDEFTITPTRNYYRPTGREGVGGIVDYFDGEADSDIGLKAGLGHDFWAANQPNIVGLQRKAKTAEEGFQACIEAGPGTPKSCKDVSALMKSAVGNPAREAQALGQI